MKKLLFISLIVIAAVSCSNDNKESGPIKVKYNLVTGEQILRSDFIKRIEVIPLQTESAPIVGDQVTSMVIMDGIIYYFDPHGNQKLLLYDLKGNFLNTIGTVGNGPEEYIDVDNFWINDDGTVSMYSSSQNMECVYKKTGEFIRKVDQKLEPYQMVRRGDWEYFYFGEGRGPEYKLTVMNNESGERSDYLRDHGVISMSIAAPIFTRYEEGYFVCEPWGNDILWMESGKEPEIKYTFDYGEYNLPKEFFANGFEGSMDYLMDHPFLVKDLFVESDNYSILSNIITKISDSTAFCLFGIHDKSKRDWRWLKLNVPGPNEVVSAGAQLFTGGGMKYVDNEAVYFVAEPMLLKEAGLSDLIPEIQKFSDDDNTVILKCYLR